MNESSETQVIRGSRPDAADAAGSTPAGSNKEQDATRFVVFLLGDHYFAVESAAVGEVVRDISLTPLPNLPDWLLGIANLRSEIVTIVDLAALCGCKPSTTGDSAKHVVLRSAEYDALIAFKVDKLREITTLDVRNIERGASEAPEFVSGTTEYRSEMLNVLNCGRLFDSLNLV